MLSDAQVRVLRNSLVEMEAPVLSLYVNINPALPENAGKAWMARVKGTLKEMDFPDNLRSAVAGILRDGDLRGRTLALFARDPENYHRLTLQVDLPVVDLVEGRVDARWGTPNLAPILYALDEFERTGVIWISGEQWRFFEFYLDEMEELTDALRDIKPEEWAELSKHMPSLQEALVRGHRPKSKDRWDARVDAWVHRFYLRLAALLEAALAERSASRLVLMGPEVDTRFFENYLSRAMRGRIATHLPVDLPPETSAGEIRNLVLPVLQEMERAGEMKLLDRIREQPGVWGVDPVLGALQEARADVVVAPWDLDTRAWRCPSGWVAATRDEAMAMCPGEEPAEEPLRQLLVELAERYGARVEWVRGESEDRLRKEMEGMAALRRW